VLSAGARAHPAVAFLGAAIEDDAAAAAAFVTRNDVPYPAGEIVAGSYLRYGVTGPPETFFIDTDGHVAAHVVGPLTADALEARLEALR
jgi:thiol:disulfide interchange protein